MSQFQNLKISVDSLMNETKRISQFLASKETSLIFFHNVLQADIDYESYCSLYASIKEYAGTIPLDENMKIIKEKISELPPVSKKDFVHSRINVPTIVLFFLLPLGIIIWIINFFHITALADKLRNIERTLGMVDFMLKAVTN
jgi:hypothetical protein